MAFNEILIPQDSFTETNVTRKRSVVGKFLIIIKDHNEKIYFFEEIIFTKTRHILFKDDI